MAEYAYQARIDERIEEIVELVHRQREHLEPLRRQPLLTAQAHDARPGYVYLRAGRDHSVWVEIKRDDNTTRVAGANGTATFSGDFSAGTISPIVCSLLGIH